MSTPNLGALSIRIIANTATMEGDFKKRMKYLGIFGGAVLAQGIGQGIINGFKKGLAGAKELEAQIARIKTLTNGVQFAAFDTDTILQMSNDLAVSVKDLTDAQYLALSSGVKVAEVNDTVAASAKFARTQNVELKTGIFAVATALNAYRDSGMTAAKATDVLTQAANQGLGTVDQFSKYIATAIPIASRLGVTFEELSALMAASTLTGKSARVAATGLKVAMQVLADPTKKAAQQFEKLTGKTFSDFIAKGGTVQEAFEKLTSSLSKEGLARVFSGNNDALSAILQLGNMSKKTLDDIVQKTKDSAGDTEAAWKITTDTLQFRSDKARISWQNMLTKMGTLFTEFRNRVLVRFQGLIEGFTASLDEHWPAIQAFVAQMIEAFVSIATAFSRIDWAGLGSIIATAAAGFAPLILAIKTVYDNMSGIVDAINAVIGVVQTFSPILAGVVALFVTYKTVMIATAAATKVLAIAQAATTAVMTAYTVVLNVLTYASAQAALGNSFFAASWEALTFAIMSNPIGAVVALIVALGVAFVVAWKKSETFRKIVVNTMNAIKDGTLQAVKVIIEAFFLWFTIPLKLVQGVLAVWAKVPDWLGGGVANDVKGAVDGMLHQIDNWKGGLQGLIDKAQAADIALQSLFDKAERLNEKAAQEGLWFGNADTDKALRDTIAGFAGGGGGGGGGNKPPEGTDDGLDDAADKAKEAARLIAAALKRAWSDVKRIAHNTSKQAIDTIKNNFDSLYADLKDAKVGKAVIAAAQKIEKSLLKSAKKRDAYIEQLKKEKETLKDLKDSYKDTVSSMMHSFSELGDITNTDRMRSVFRQGIFPTAGNQIANLKRALYITDRFKTAIERLQKLGLKQTSLNELIAAGPENGLGAAEGLARGGAGAVKQVNDLQDQLNRSGKDLGKSLADEWYGHGIKVSEGLIAGLEKDRDKIIKVMDGIGDAMAASFKKKLGIHSPSRVFAGFGEQITAGLSQGVTGSLSNIRKANNSLAQQSVNFGPGSVVVNGVKNGDEQKGGMLTGRGIVGVLESRSTRAALAGIG